MDTASRRARGRAPRPRAGWTPRSVLSALFCVCAAGALGAGAARADDWSQFRHDAGRTAASQEPLALPLVEIWKWDNAMPRHGVNIEPGGRMPRVTLLSACVGWHDRLYFCCQAPHPSNPGVHVEQLLCVDARTGIVLWRQPTLGGGFAGMGPGVTDTGLVVVADGAAGGDVRGGSRPPARTILRAFSALDGRPAGALELGPDNSSQLPPAITALFLDDAAGAVRRMEPLAQREDPRQPVGPLAVAGASVTALSGVDLLFHWLPGQVPAVAAVQRMGHTPQSAALAGAGPDYAMFARYPLAIGPEGIAVVAQQGKFGYYARELPGVVEQGAYGGSGFLAMLGANLMPRWHRDDLPNPGMITLAEGAVFMHLRDGIAAVDARTGVNRWFFPAPSARRAETRRVLAVGLQARRPPAGGGQALPAFPAGDGWQLTMPGSTAARQDGGLVVTGGRVYGQAGDVLVALDAETGRPAWQRPVPGRVRIDPASLVASRDHLIGSAAGRLFALRLDNGQPAWEQPVDESGAVTIANRMLYAATGKAVRAFAPAERTFRLALDSPRAQDYRGVAPPPAEPSEAPAPDADAQPARDVDPPADDRRWLADATVLRLGWDGSLPALLQQVEKRRQAAGTAPMLLSLDWLDPARARISSGGTGADWTPEGRAAFLDACARLAAAARPDHFDLAPEVNVFLSRSPKQLPAVLALVRDAAEAVRRGSPATKVLVSFNVEVLQRIYGRGPFRPFGSITVRDAPSLETLAPLVAAVDEVGLTACPQSAFGTPESIPNGHLLLPRLALREKPVLVTDLRVEVSGRPAKFASDNTAFLRRAIELCYWLDALVVTYPEIEVDPKETELAAAVGDADRPALGLWRDVPRWKPVTHLSAAGGPGPLPSAPGVQQPPGTPEGNP